MNNEMVEQTNDLTRCASLRVPPATHTEGDCAERDSRRLTPKAFAGKYGAERIARLLPLLESYGYINLTETGFDLLTEARRIAETPFGDQLDPADRPAAMRLREWRKLKAREDNVAAYIILSNKKLFTLAAAHPATVLDLAYLGLSRKLIESSSSDILHACRRDTPSA